MTPRECETINRMCKWDSEHLQKGENLVNKYEEFQTLDAHDNIPKKRKAIKEGTRLNMNQDLFVKFSRLSKDLIVNNESSVLQSLTSLRSIINMNEEDILRTKKHVEIVRESGYQNFSDIVEKHPTEFQKDKVDRIPLRDKNKVLKLSDNSLEKKINRDANINMYAKSVLNPQSTEMDNLLNEANGVRKDLKDINHLIKRSKRETIKVRLNIFKRELEFDSQKVNHAVKELEKHEKYDFTGEQSTSKVKPGTVVEDCNSDNNSETDDDDSEKSETDVDNNIMLEEMNNSAFEDAYNANDSGISGISM